MYMGTNGLYAPTFAYERNPSCIACSSARIELAVPRSATLEKVLGMLVEDERTRFKAPSVRSEGGLRGDTLYVRGALEATSRPNLALNMTELVRDGALLTVTDATLPSNTTVVIRFVDG